MGCTRCFHCMRCVLMLLLLMTSCTFAVRAQDRAKGNYLVVTPWTVSFLRLGKDQKARWFVRSCTYQEEEVTGSWIQSGDTVVVRVEDNSTKFLLKEGRLCALLDGAMISTSSGMKRTFIRSLWHAQLRAKRLRRKR